MSAARDDTTRLAHEARSAGEQPSPDVCLHLARGYEQTGDHGSALHWALATVDAADSFTAWQAAAAIAARTAPAGPEARRTARLALVGSYTTNQLATMLWLAALRLGVLLEVHETPYGQYRQELLDPDSATYAFDPDLILLAVHADELTLPRYSSSPDEDVAGEVQRWHSLWRAGAANTSATVVQHLFAVPPDAPFGHFGATLRGSRAAMMQAVNTELAASRPEHVAVVDCERLAALAGKQRWFDARYWHLAKQAVALECVPLLARHTAAVIAARLGLSRKCLALDLDNTLWGGVVGEDGLAGIQLGDTPDGEAFQAFQDSILGLKERGVVLAVCSKNNEADAREVFERHPAMRIGLDDIAVFVADWRSKPEQLRSVASELDLGLDSIVFVDDNPVEREAVRQLLPEVDVLALPRDPSDFSRVLFDYLLFEPAAFTGEDAQRTDQYRGRRLAAEAAGVAESIDDFYRSLDMRTTISPFSEADLPRIAQLVGKTNQFNLTTHRHSATRLTEFMSDTDCVHRTFRLSDRFADHGLVALVIAFVRGTALEIDTWLMSCRVIGRTLEQTVLEELVASASERGCTRLTGSYIPTAKNALVADLYDRLGFALVSDEEGITHWARELGAGKTNDFITVERAQESIHAAA